MDTSETSAKEEAYFVGYADRASKMKDWQLVSEIANKMTNLDDMEEDANDSSMKSRTSRQVEILMKENQRRRKI